MVAKLRNMVSLSFLVYTRDIPSRVVLRDHSLQFEGCESDPGDLITGVYGTPSKQMALVCAATWSRERGSSSSGSNRILMLDTNYRVDNYDLTRAQAREEIVEKTGWLHLDRIASSYREEIKAQWLGWLAADAPHGVVARVQDLSLADIAQRYPQYVRKMMLQDPGLRGIVHPVNPQIDPTVVLWAATVRYESDRFEGPVVRFLPQVDVVV